MTKTVNLSMKYIIPLYQMLILSLRKLHMCTYDLPTYRQTHITYIHSTVSSVRSVAQSCLTVCHPVDWSTPGFPVHHQYCQSLLKLMSIESVMPSNQFTLCHPISSCLQSFPATGSFPISQLFTSNGQSIGTSTLASVLPMTILV